MKTRLGLTMVLAIGAVAGANANMFMNGNFEMGDFSFWNIAPTANGQTGTQAVIQFDIDGGGPRPTNFAGQFEVGELVFSGNPAGMELTQTLALTAGLIYYFDYDWAVDNQGSSGNVEGGIFSLIVNGNVVGSSAAGGVANNSLTYGHTTGIFTPTVTGNYVVGGRIERPFVLPGQLYQMVDNFAVTAIVPEPATMAVLGLGLAAMARRRRNK